MLSKDSEEILKILKEQDEKYKEKGAELNQNETSKVSYRDIKEVFSDRSFITVNMLLKYLLEERYVYNHIEGKEHVININDLSSNNVQLVLGEKGYAYLQHKNYRLFAQIIPLIVSVFSLLISIFNLFLGWFWTVLSYLEIKCQDSFILRKIFDVSQSLNDTQSESRGDIESLWVAETEDFKGAAHHTQKKEIGIM